jgi:acetyltransferase
MTFACFSSKMTLPLHWNMPNNIMKNRHMGLCPHLWFNPRMDNSLLPFFRPRGVVVIGASTAPEKLGYGVARNLIQSGYTGAIHFVGQRTGALFGRPLHTNLSQVPDPVDLAILIVPSQTTPQTIAACGQRGIHAAIIMSSGFCEVGEEGAALERQCLEAARAYGVRLLGPNCIGTLDTHLPLDTTFLQPPMPAAGHIGFISHSGAFCAAIIDWARGRQNGGGFGFSQIVSLGNQADVHETDILPMLAADEHTRVIVIYMEGIADGRRFVQIASETTQRKPVIALKVGRFEAGQRAAASHTGALAASDTAFEAAFDKAGVLRAETAEQMFDWARALENCPLPRTSHRPRSATHPSAQGGIAILTNAGGPGVIAADALERHGLTLAALGESTRAALSAELPPAASVRNPVDMLASASPAQYAACLNLLLADEAVDGVMVILPPPPMFKAEDVAEAMIPLIRASDKPVVVALMGSTLVETARSRFENSQVPTYPFPERAASALGALSRRAEFMERRGHGEPQRPPPQSSILRGSINDLLLEYGIPTAAIRLARNADKAAVLAGELGFPVVMKVASPDILHKSDVGGVMLNLQNQDQVREGYARMLERMRVARPEAQIDGVHLQRQIPQGQEVIVGMVRDPQFGPLMMVGSGGVEVEGLKDVAFGLAPLNRAEAREMLRKTWMGRKLRGFRNIPPADEESVIDVLVQLSHLAMDNEQVEEIEVNPLRVLDRGAVAVDVRVKFGSFGGSHAP